jgi:hypothetical protein
MLVQRCYLTELEKMHMQLTQKLTYTNRTQGRLAIIIEPWAQEYSIDPGEQIDVEVRQVDAEVRTEDRGRVELEQTNEGLTIWIGWAGTVMSVLRDGKELVPNGVR